jgi:hypothetical protein
MSIAPRQFASVTGRVAVFATAALLSACAGTLPRPSTPHKPNDEALLVLPGFGYGRAGHKALRSLAPTTAAEGVDLYVADYLTRDGLAGSREKLRRFVRDNHLDRYRRLHVFAFLAGAWTMNPLLEHQLPANLASVVYDRSPFQERAPAIAADKLRVFAWLRYGSTIFDVARTPYAPFVAPQVRVALLVESAPTAFIRHHAEAARAYGPFAFACSNFGQPHDDCAYVPLSHDELYVHFPELWPELRSFIRTSRFTSAMSRTPPAGDALARAQS